MTDTQEAPSQPAGPSISVLRQYIKDLSFENPGAQTREQPKIDLGIDVGAKPIEGQDGVFEVTLKLNARAGTDDVTLFLLEMDYAGLFQLRGFSSQSDIEAVVLIECPRLMFPFARRIIADISSEGGFPPLRIDPVDFAALYQSQRQQAAQNAAPAPDEA